MAACMVGLRCNRLNTAASGKSASAIAPVVRDTDRLATEGDNEKSAVNAGKRGCVTYKRANSTKLPIKSAAKARQYLLFPRSKPTISASKTQSFLLAYSSQSFASNASFLLF
jgi:hypothetical protein